MVVLVVTELSVGSPLARRTHFSIFYSPNSGPIARSDVVTSSVADDGNRNGGTGKDR